VGVLPQFFQKNKKIIALVLVTLLLIWAINVTSKPREQVSFPERVIGYIVLPIQKAFNFVKVEFNQAYLFFYEVGATKGEKEKLSLEVQQLQDQLRELNDIKKENERLKQMLGIKNEYKDKNMEAAQVIGRNPDNLNSVILINKGTNNGFNVNNEVISVNRGLIGRIIEVSTDWSKVMLITDPESSVSTILDRTRDLAVATGDAFASKYGFIKLTYILPEADIITDDIVVTSGYGGIFSKGILVGKVKEVKQEPNELTKYAYIEPAADFKRLEEVFVIKSSIKNVSLKEGKR